MAQYYSCEAIAFQRCFDVIRSGLQNEMEAIVPRLFAREIISDLNMAEVLAEGVRGPLHLVTILLHKIRSDSAYFNRILKEISSCPELHSLEGRLRESLERVKSETVPPRQPDEEPPPVSFGIARSVDRR